MNREERSRMPQLAEDNVPNIPRNFQVGTGESKRRNQQVAKVVKPAYSSH